MKNQRSILTLLTPSELGFISYISIALVTFFAQDFYLRQHLSGIYQNVNGEGHLLSNVNSVLSNFLGSSKANILVLIIFWAIVGLAIYSVAHGLIGDISEFAQDLSLRNYVWPQNTNRNKPLLDFIKRIVFRVIMVLAGIFYVLFILKIFLEHKLPNIYSASGLTVHNVVIAIIWIALFVVALHILVVMLRLILLKPRVFSSSKIDISQ